MLAGPNQPLWPRASTSFIMFVLAHCSVHTAGYRNARRILNPGTRGYVERNSIALTSMLAAGKDLPSPGWLGHHAIPGQIRQSGLWNVEHVTNPCHPDFLPTLEQLIQHHR